MFASLRIRTALVFVLSLSVPAIANAATITLAWNANPEGNIGGYVLVYGTTPGSYSASVDVGNALTHSITTLTSGTRYYFAVRAYNTSNVSGPLSGEVNELAIDTPPPPPPPPPPPVLVAAYGFGEASGSSALDKTSNNNDGTLGGGITRTSAGRFGSALVFDGINGIVTIPSTTSLDLTGAYTLEAWISPSASGGWRTAVMKESAVGHTYVLYSNTGATGASAHAQTSSDRTATAPAVPPLNAWTHLAAVSDGTNLRLLVNGQQAATISLLSAVVSSTAPLGIGGNMVWGEYFAGTIDEVRIYRGALTDAQVQQDMITPVDPVDSTTPTVSITSPAAGASITGSVTLTATAADNVAVAGVRFELDGSSIGAEDLTSPYALVWNSSTVPNGSHLLTAIARDTSGNLKTSAAVSVTVSNDSVPPTVALISPPSGASSVALGTSVTATFSEAINAATLTTTTFVLRNPANAVVPAAVSYNAGTRVATLTPSAALTTSTTYTATITGGAAGVKDVAGNALASSVAWSFATILGDTTPPTVTGVTPANGATDVGTTTLVTATFGEPMAAASITTTTFELKNAAGAVVPAAVAYDAAARTATLTPSAALTPGVTFTATIMGGAGGVRDVAGNVATGHTAWSFSVAVQTSTGPVAVYGFDEGTGSVLRDLSGNQLDGTILGATWQSGRFGRSLEFNGVNNWVTIPANGLLDLSTAVTIEAWVYPTVLGGWKSVVVKETTAGHTYALYADGDALGAGGHMQTAVDAKAHQPTNLPLGQWSHLTTTYDGQAVRLFVNAIEVANTPASGPVDVSGDALRIGGNSIWGEHFVGRIDEVRLYGRALSAAEIATDMGTPAGGWLAAAYGFNETAGSTAADASGHLLTGVVTAATWTAGRFGNGLQFNGTDSWVTVPHSNWLDLTTGLTVEAWVYPTNGGGWRTVVLKEAAGGHTFALYSDDGVAPGAHLQATTDVISRGTVPLPLETWTHLAATYDGTRLRLYTNGVLTSNQPVAGVPVTSTGVLRVGGNEIWGEHFAGIIDEVRIYYRALTAAEISADMTTPIR